MGFNSGFKGLKNHNFVAVPLYRVLVGKSEEKVPLGRCTRGWEL